jgi:hypothetical protein
MSSPAPSHTARLGRGGGLRGVIGWLKDGSNLVFALLLLILLIPIWSFHYFPSQDGPAHLENAALLLDYQRPDRPLPHDFYVLNANPNPNWLGHLILAGLMLVAPPLIAEKILLSGYVLLLPCAARYVIRIQDSGATFLAVLAFPWVYNWFLHMGFYNFCYSLALFFFVVGYWQKHQDHFGIARTLVLLLLCTLLYFCHPIALVAAGLAIAVLCGWQTWTELRNPRPPSSLRHVLFKRLLPPALAFLPASVMTLHFAGQHANRAPTPFLPWQRLQALPEMEALLSFRVQERTYAGLTFLLFLGLTVLCLVVQVLTRPVDRRNGWLIVAGVFLILYLVAPPTMGTGFYIPERLIPLPFFALMVWFANQPRLRRLKWPVEVVAVLLTLAMLGSHWRVYQEANAYLDEYLSAAPLIEPNSTVLPLCFAQGGRAPDGDVFSPRVRLFLHAAGHLAVQTGAIDLTNYEANTDYFPMEFRPDKNPYRHLGLNQEMSEGGLEEEPPKVAFYPPRAGIPVDYVLLWDWRKDRDDPAATQSIERQLNEGFELIQTSQPRGLMQLYRRKARP